MRPAGPLSAPPTRLTLAVRVWVRQAGQRRHPCGRCSLDRDEATALLRRDVTRLSQSPYGELVTRVGHADAYAVRGASGTEYQVEVDVLWDDRPGGAIRVIASIDDGGLRSALRPITESILVERG